MNKNKINLVVQQENQSLMGSSNASSLQSWKWSTLFQISICYDYKLLDFQPAPFSAFVSQSRLYLVLALAHWLSTFQNHFLSF